MNDPLWGSEAIDPLLLTDVNMPIHDAVRISIADIFYFRCHSLESECYTGGVVDLFPIELAKRLANRVIMEMKAPFEQMFAIPALRMALGIDGNRRLEYVHGEYADVWIDASDSRHILRKYGIQKRLCWHQNRIRLLMPSGYATYVEHVEAQWQYGYQRGMEAFSRRAANDKQHMRHVTRHNWGKP
jgi:hypothetical protein